MIKRYYKKWIIITSLLIVIAGIVYYYFYMRHYAWHEIRRTDTSCYLGDAREIFFKFKEKEKRFPSCMDEVILSPYNEIYLLNDNMDCFSNLPFRCVTLRNMYYQVKDTKQKVLITLYKPYQTRLWPFGEMKTTIMLDDGSIYTVSPDEIIIE
jgi:hypothetical protein